MKDSATRKNGFAKTCSFLAASLLAVCFLLVPAAEAKKYPDWISVRYVGYTVQVQKGTTENDSGHLRLVLHFDITNNNKNGRIMTAIFDRSITWNGEIKQGPNISKVGFVFRGTSPYKGEWYPGQSYRYKHEVNIRQLNYVGGQSGKFSTPYWNALNRGLKTKNSLYGFIMRAFNLDFQISSRTD